MLKFVARNKINEESKTQSSYSLSLIAVSRLKLMNKSILEVACKTLDPNIFTKTLWFVTKSVMTHKYTLKVRQTLMLEQSILDISKVLFETFI